MGLLNEWAKQPGADPHLLAAARGELLDILDRLVSDDMTAQAVGSMDGTEAPSLMLVGTTGILDVSVAGPPDEPVIEVELLHVKLPPIGVTLTVSTAKLARYGSGAPDSWRETLNYPSPADARRRLFACAPFRLFSTMSWASPGRGFRGSTAYADLRRVGARLVGTGRGPRRAS